MKDFTEINLLFLNLSTIPYLQSLVLENIYFTDEKLQIPDKSFQELKILELRNNNINPMNCKNLFKALKD